ncbi:MAG TPA: hypothetical protein DEQ61_04035 [Streptomyces sp.]|nr:hypothetical protein [Streptomyces sp.]
MKQGTARILGAAVLGAGFAVAAAGTASAASLVPPVPAAGDAMPQGAPEAPGAGQNPLGSITDAVQKPGPGGQQNPLAGLLGGLPIGGALG